MHPRARTTDIETTRIEDELHILDVTTGVAHRLHPMTACVWRHADGTRTVADLLAVVQAEQAPKADEEAIWLALDALADADLLEERIAPPAGLRRISRRDLIKRAAAVGAGLSSIMVSPLHAQSPPGSGEQQGKESKNKEQSSKGTGENKRKQAEARRKEQVEQRRKRAEKKRKRAEQKKKQAEEQRKERAEQKIKQAEQKRKKGEQRRKQTEQRTKRRQEQKAKQKAAEQRGK